MRTLLYEKDFKSYSDDLDELGLAGTFSYPKTVYLIQYLLQVVDNGGIVLEFFLWQRDYSPSCNGREY